MTDPVKGVSGSQGASAGGGFSGGGYGEHQKKRKTPPAQEDVVDISRDARNRLKGPVKKGILEYLKELLS